MKGDTLMNHDDIEEYDNPFDKILAEVERQNAKLSKLEDISDPTDAELEAIEKESKVTSVKVKTNPTPKEKIIKASEQEETTTSKKDESGVLDWAFKLDNVPDEGIIMEEFGKQKYLFKPVMDPNNMQTGYFTVHCNQIGEEDSVLDGNGDPIKKNGKMVTRDRWHTENTILTKVYNVGHLEKFVKWLKAQTKFVSNSVLSISPFHMSWNGRLNNKMNVFDSDVNKLIFETISGIDGEEFEELSNSVDINILNSYNGKASVYLDFIMNLSAKDSNGKEYVMKDFFTLARRGHKVLHKGKFNEIVSDIAKVSNFMNEEIPILKSYKPTEKDIDMIGSKLKEGSKKVFKDRYDMLAGPDKNLFYCMLLASIALNDTYNAQRHAALRPIIDKLVDVANKKYEEEKASATKVKK